MRIYSPDLDELAKLARNFAALLTLEQFKILKHEDDGSIEIGIVGAGRKIESTECTPEFLHRPSTVTDTTSRNEKSTSAQ